MYVHKFFLNPNRPIGTLKGVDRVVKVDQTFAARAWYDVVGCRIFPLGAVDQFARTSRQLACSAISLPNRGRHAPDQVVLKTERVGKWFEVRNTEFIRNRGGPIRVCRVDACHGTLCYP